MGRRPRASQPSRIPGGVVFGLLLAGIGSLALLSNLGLLHVDDLFRLWPGILIFLGLVGLINRGILAVWPHILLTVGVVTLAGFNGYASYANRYWPLGIVWIGVVMTLRAITQAQRPTPSAGDAPPLPQNDATPQDDVSRQS